MVQRLKFARIVQIWVSRCMGGAGFGMLKFEQASFARSARGGPVGGVC